MSQPMSQTFVTSFLTTCFEAGLTKEAAAQLLQKESVDRVRRGSKAWSEGYEKVASQVPGNLQPMLFSDGDMEKVARSGLLQAAKGLKEVIFGSGRAVGNAVRGIHKGVKSVAGPGPSFTGRYPRTAALGAAALTGAGTLGAYHLLNRDRGLMNPYGASDPFFGPGGYDPATYEGRYEDKLYNDYGPGIFSHNKEYFGTEHRRKQLEEALANGQGDGNTYRELVELNRRHATLGDQREGHLNRLNSAAGKNRELMDRIANRQADLENQRTAWWAAPKRWFLSATGRDPGDHFDAEIAKLQDSSSQAQLHSRLIGDRRRLLEAGATGRKTTKPPTRKAIQENFFPTFPTD